MELPDDLLLEILRFLPPKSLLRFRCVSKSWLALISNPRIHTKFNFPLVMFGLFLWSTKYIPTQKGLGISLNTSLDFLPKHSDLRILDCSNGLLLCRGRDIHSKTTYYVCNPATKTFTAIPLPDQLIEMETICYSLDFDPRSSQYFMYRLSHIFERITLQVFSSKTGKWDERQVNVGLGDFSVYTTAFFKGILHVLGVKNHVLGINREGVVCRRIQLTASQCSVDSRLAGLSGGCLQYAAISQKELRIWVLENYDSDCWVSKREVVLEDNGFKIKAFHSDLDVIFLELRMKLYSYHLITAELTEIYKFKYVPVVYPYSPCLEDFDGGQSAARVVQSSAKTMIENDKKGGNVNHG